MQGSVRSGAIAGAIAAVIYFLAGWVFGSDPDGGLVVTSLVIGVLTAVVTAGITEYISRSKRAR